MSVKAKTKKRLVLLVAAVVGVGALGAGGWAYHLHRRAAYYAGERAAGMAAAEGNKDPMGAVQHLGQWLSRNPDDVEALSAYAKERLLTESENNSHIWDAISRLRRLVELQPGVDEPRRQLMQLYARYGFTTEALDTAEAVLAKNPADVDGLRYKLGALMRLRKWDDARKVADQWVKADPTDPEPQLRVLGLMAQTNRPAAEILARAKADGAKDPNSPVAQLVLGTAYALTDDMPSAQKMMKLAAAQKPPTPAFGRLLIDQLNRAGLYADSLDLLRRQAKESDDAETRQALVRRLWELNRADEVVALTQDQTKIGPEGIAFRALALMQLGKRDEAKQELARLSAAKNDALSEAWAGIITQQMDPAAIDARKLLSLCQHGASKDSEGGYLRYFIGQAYAQLDEGDLAIDAWQHLAVQNPTWSLPLVRLSDARLEKGRYAMAMAAAQEAVRRSPDSALTAINLAKVWGASVESGHAERQADLLQLIANIRKQLPQEEQTLGMQVSLLAGMKRTDEAKAQIKGALAAKDAPSEQTLLRLAAISRAYDLGLADACFEKSEQAHGMTAGLAYARAVYEFSQGKGADGLAILKGAREKAKNGSALEWELAWGRYLEVTQDPASKETWIKLADGHPEDRQVQQLALEVRSTRSDRAFVDRTIDRLRKLSGDEGVSWKLARARWLLEGAKTDQDLAQATVLLKDVIRAAADSVEPHVLLARAYEKLNNQAGAVEELKAAAAADPANTQVALYLSQLLQKRGEFDKAREVLARVANGKTTDAGQKRQAAVLMAQQGDSKRAIELLQDGGGDEKDGGNTLLLAMLYRQQNQLGKAEEVVKKLLETPEPVVIQFAADLYAQEGKRDEADKALALLDVMKLKPGVKELLLADHACRYLGPDQAIAYFRASLKAAPENGTAWKALVGYYAYLGRGKEMTETAAEGLRAVPGEAALTAVVGQKDLLAEADGDAETRPLVISFLADARPDAPSLQAMQAIAASKRNGESADQTVGKLRKIVDAYPTYEPLQSILVARYIRANRADDAAQLASRAVQMFPNDPEPARLAVEAMSASRRWDEALSFAKTWRERSLSNPMPADMAISACLMQKGEAAAAAKAIEAYVPQAVAAPDRGANLIVQYASALNAAGQGEKAAEVLWPLAQGSGPWRKIWIQVGLGLPNQQASAWLDRVAGIIPAGSEEERAVLAGAWHVIGSRGKDAGAIAKSNAIFDELLAKPDVTAGTVLSRGIAAEIDNDYKTAEAAYRRALKLDPTAVVAQNNLAMLILKDGGDVGEAIQLAKAAVATRPGAPTLHDTLAMAQAKGKDVDGAVASLRKALELEPNSLEWRVHMARIMLDGGRRKDADKVMQEIATLPAGRTPTSAETERQLKQLRDDMAKQPSASAQTQG